MRAAGVNAAACSREPYRQGIRQLSAGSPLGEHKAKLTENQIPVLTPGMPVLHDPLGSQVQHPAQGIVIGKRWLVLRDLAELPVETIPRIV